MPVINFKQPFQRRANLTDPTDFNEDGEPLWVTATDKGPLLIRDMSDQHLMNSIAFVKRMFGEWKDETLGAMHDWLQYLSSEMVDFYSDKDIGDVEETVVTDWCPRVRYLEREADRRNLR